MKVDTILIYSDLQLHLWKQFGIDESGMSKRLAQQQSILNQVSDLNKKHHVDLDIFGGDWWHLVGDHPTEVMLVTEQFFKRERTPTLFADGNHDLKNTLDPKWFENATAMLRRLAQDPGDIEGIQIKIVNYQDEVDYDAIKGYDLVVLHKQPELTNDFGFKMEGVDWRRLAKNNRLVFFGHDHTRRQLADNCWVIGSPMHLTFGDKGDRGAWLIDTKTWKVTFIKLEYPEFRTVKTAAEVQDDGNYYKVLDAGKEDVGNNAIAVRTPTVYNQRIQSDSFRDILAEWCTMNGKGADSINVIQDIVKDKVQTVHNFFTGRLSTVYIKHFMSVGEAKYSLKNGVTFISGMVTRDDEGGSNGAGKSSMTGEPIVWALFGVTTKGLTGDSVIQRGYKDCTVTLTLTDVGRVVYVSRSRKEGLNVTVATKDGQQDLTSGYRQQERQEILEALLGFDSKTFLSACYFSQENLMMLTGLTDGDRTDMITKLLGFEEYDDIYGRVFERQKELGTDREKIEEEQRKISTQIEVITSKISSNQEFVRSVEKDKDDLTAVRDEYRNKVAGKQKLLDEMKKNPKGVEEVDYDARIVEAEKKKKIVTESITGIDKDINDNKYDAKIDELSGKTSKLYGEDLSLKNSITICNNEIRNPGVYVDLDAEYEKRNNLKVEIGGLLKDEKNDAGSIEKLEHEIKDLQDLKFGERCDQCGALITKDNANKFIEEKKAEVARLRDSMLKGGIRQGECNDEIKKIDAEIKKKTDDATKAYVKEREDKVAKATTRREEIKKAVAELEQESDKIRKAVADMREERALFETKLRRLNDDISGMQQKKIEQEQAMKASEIKEAELKKEIEAHKKTVEVTQQSIDECDSKIEDMIKTIRKLKGDIAGYEKQAQECGEKDKAIVNNIDAMEFWKTAFSSKGIRSVLLDKFCNDFNSIVNDYLAMASNGTMSVDVSPTAYTKAGEERNKISINVYMEGEMVHYESLSGGEKRRVDIALCLALNQYVLRQGHKSQGLLGVIIMDEMFSYIDRLGEESIATLLFNESREKSILVISHTPELSSYADRVWTVHRVGGVSTLKTQETP